MVEKRTRSRRKNAIGHVMIVEDEALLAFALEEALLDAGARKVTICASTKEAMAALDQEPVDAIVLDVHLADSDDGWALAELAVQLGPRPPRILFSTGAPQDIPPRIAELGPVFAKPYNPVELVDAIRERAGKRLFAKLRGALG